MRHILLNFDDPAPPEAQQKPPKRKRRTDRPKRGPAPGEISAMLYAPPSSTNPPKEETHGHDRHHQ